MLKLSTPRAQRMSYQIPRNSLVWMLIAQAGVILPHLTRLPIWIVALWGLVLVWRIQVYRSRWSFPGTIVKLVLVVSGCAGIKFHYGSFLGIDPMVSLLIIAFLLKLVEMQTRRDALVVIFLGFFVGSTQFLFDQTILASLYAVFSIVLMIIALLGAHQSTGQKKLRRTAWTGTKLFLQSLPIMLLLFLIMPRIGTLWSVPLQRSAAQTGVSDSMSPGDFANLTRSGKLAFRVSFEGDMPPRNELYWRGLVFELFDGRTWTQSQRWLYKDGRAIDWAIAKPSQWRSELENLAGNRQDESLWRYDIVMEPTQQAWLYGLAMPLDIPPEAGLTRVFSLISKSPVRQRHRYKGVSVRNYVLERELSDWQRVRQLQLPPGFNPETRETAERWRRESPSDQALIDRLLQHYNEKFTYTLSPPALGRNTVDEFLWGTQQGFCEHFASSFVFFMRAAGIPARVVGGYQGGELSPAGDYLLVHQFDAHAWAEVWLEGRGWVRVDPTASVAPQRIEYGLNDALSDEESQLLADPLSLVYYRNISLLNSLRLSWDSLNYYWYQSVIGYDDDKQENFFREWLGGLEPWRLASALIGGAAMVLGFISLSAWLGSRRKLDPFTKDYQRMLRRLSREGLDRSPGEAPGDFAARVARERPDLAESVRRITELYESVMYAGFEGLAPELKRQARRFSPF